MTIREALSLVNASHNLIEISGRLGVNLRSTSSASSSEATWIVDDGDPSVKVLIATHHPLEILTRAGLLGAGGTGGETSYQLSAFGNLRLSTDPRFAAVLSDLRWAELFRNAPDLRYRLSWKMNFLGEPPGVERGIATASLLSHISDFVGRQISVSGILRARRQNRGPHVLASRADTDDPQSQLIVEAPLLYERLRSNVAVVGPEMERYLLDWVVPATVIGRLSETNHARSAWALSDLAAIQCAVHADVIHCFSWITAPDAAAPFP